MNVCILLTLCRLSDYKPFHLIHIFFCYVLFFIFKSSQSAACNESRAINSFPLTLVFLLVYNETWEVYPQCANHHKKLLASQVTQPKALLMGNRHAHEMEKATASYGHETSWDFSDNCELQPIEGRTIKNGCKQERSFLTALSEIKS